MLRQAQHEAPGHEGAARAGTPGMRKKWRHSRSILKDGVEAALRTSPEVLENCKPKTNYGALVRGLVLEASKSKATPLKTVMALIDWEGEDDPDAEEDFPDAGRRDWSPDGVWETMPEAEVKQEPGAVPVEEPADDAPCPAREELRRRLNRLVEAGQHEHVARIVAAIRAGEPADPEPVPTG